MALLSKMAARLNQSRQQAAKKGFDYGEFSEGFFTRVLHSIDNKSEESRAGSQIIHVSTLLRECPRMMVIASQERNIIQSSVTGGHRVMWKIGRAVETHVRDTFLEGFGHYGLIGEWSCRCGKLKYVGLFRDRETCGICKGCALAYREMTLVDTTYGIVGNPDLLFLLNDEIYVVEIKSINSREFDELTDAKPDHKYQAHCYRRLAVQTLSNFKVSDTVILLYVTKDFKWGSPYKEFHSLADDAMSQTIDNFWIKAEWVKKHLAVETLPARLGACSCSTSTTAKNCPVLTTCFNRR